jgi:transcriptional regulator with XRE-family HTH domain
MNEHEKQRDAASQTLIDLRTKLGKSQASFAVEVMKTAVTTVARWETNGPPRGEVLIRLRDIAREHRLYELASRFELIYRQEMEKPLPSSRLTWVPATANGLLTVPLAHESALGAAQDFMILLAQLDSPDPKIKRNAVSAFAVLRKAARRLENPAVGEIQDAFRAAGSGGQK